MRERPSDREIVIHFTRVAPSGRLAVTLEAPELFRGALALDPDCARRVADALVKRADMIDLMLVVEDVPVRFPDQRCGVCDDAVVECLDLLGVPGARPYSPAECVTRDILPGIRRLRERLNDIEDAVRGLPDGEDLLREVGRLERDRPRRCVVRSRRELETEQRGGSAR